MGNEARGCEVGAEDREVLLDGNLWNAVCQQQAQLVDYVVATWTQTVADARIR